MCARERVHAQRELEQIAPCCAPARVPQTFGLDPEELLKEANRLHQSGWSVAEIVQTLAVPLPPAA